MDDAFVGVFMPEDGGQFHSENSDGHHEMSHFSQ